MNKYKLYMIVCICILVLSIGGSLAWYVWTSSSTYLSLSMCVPEISFIGGETINGTGLKPITDKEQGLKKEIDVKLNSICKEGDSAVMNLYMTLDSLPEGLKHETFMFEVVKDNKVLYSGNFKDKVEGTTITLLEDQVITEDASTYFVYVYIDGTRDNPKNMAGQNFRFSVYGEGTNAIYKENVIANPTTPTDSSSVFLTSSLKRNEIEEITIVENNQVPEELQSIAEDISSNEDGSVMLWYEDSDNNGLYEVYIGSSNGIIMTNTNGDEMFAYMENIEYLDLSRFDTSNITRMYSMFEGDINLKELNLSNFNTSKVTNMSAMFRGCNKLTSLDLSHFDTSNVNTIKSMFSGCTSLTSLDLSNFNTSNVKEMSWLFEGCKNLTQLNINTWDTSNVITMEGMFLNCNQITELDIKNFDTSNVINVVAMFAYCSSLIELDLSNFDTGNVTNMKDIFAFCSSLIELDLSHFDTLNVTNMRGMFYDCKNLTSLDLSSFYTSNVTDMTSMFNNCTDLTTIYVSDLWDISNITISANMFLLCESLVGSQDTVYNSNYIDKTYARVDGGTERPGYLTLKTV